METANAIGILTAATAASFGLALALSRATLTALFRLLPRRARPLSAR